MVSNTSEFHAMTFRSCTTQRALRFSHASICFVLAAHSATTQANATSTDTSSIRARLIAGYPGIVTDVTDNKVIFADGSALPLDDGVQQKSFEQWLDAPDIEDMFTEPYPWQAAITPPAPDVDPGRARNTAFFTKVYGDCTKGGMNANLVTISWLPKKLGRRLRVSSRNGVADAFAAVSRELDQLPARFDRFLRGLGGTYNCRRIAGTNRLSAHGYGIAIDIAPRFANYWRWDNARRQAETTFRNSIPAEIVEIFEKHGFIWGGRWHHYDTMHFEYRPELRPPSPDTR